MQELKNVQVTQEQLNDGDHWLIDSVEKIPDTNTSDIDDEYYIPDSIPKVSEIDRSDASELNIARANKALMCTGIRRHIVCYYKDGKRKRSAWFKTRKRAHQALDIITAKGCHGYVYVD